MSREVHVRFCESLRGRCPWATRLLILCGSEKAAANAQKVAEKYLVEDMKLKVNRTKTHIAHSSRGIKFLGVVIFTRYTIIQEKKLIAFKNKVKKVTGKTGGRNLATVVKYLNPVLRGFAYYFRIANCKKVLGKLMGWVRRRLRAVQLFLWKRPARLHRRLRQLGYHGEFKHIGMRKWRNSASPLASMAIPNKWLIELNLFDMEKVDTGFTSLL